MLSHETLTAAGWVQDTRPLLDTFYDKGPLSYEITTGDVIYAKREPYVLIAEGVRDITELEGIPRTVPHKDDRGIVKAKP